MNPFLFLEYLTTRLPYISFVQSMYILNIQCSYKTIVKKISFSWIWSRFGVVQKISPSVIIPLLPCEISWFECECLSVPQKSLLLSWVYYNNFLLNSWRHAFFTDFLGPQEGFEDTKGVIRICKSKNRQHKKNPGGMTPDTAHHSQPLLRHFDLFWKYVTWSFFPLRGIVYSIHLIYRYWSILFFLREELLLLIFE